MILSDFFKALGQLGDPRFRRVLFLGLGLTIALLFGIYALFLGALNWLTPDTLTLPMVGEVTFVDDLLSWASIFLMLLLSAFLMVPVASAFTGFFLEDVARAVEDRHYSHLPQPARIPWAVALQDSLNFFALIVVANILGLVAYAFIAATGILAPLTPFLFWGLNGFLLGREYFQLTAMRWLGRDGAKAARARHSGQIWLAGTLMAMPLTVPLLNLLIPILGAATFTHLFHRLEGQNAGKGQHREA